MDAESAPEYLVSRMRAFVEQVQAGGQLELVDQFIHPDFCDHGLDGTDEIGHDVVRNRITRLHGTVADITIEIVHIFAREGMVATHKIIRGRQIGQAMGVKGEGQPVQMRVMDFVRFRKGLMVEHWSTFNMMSSEKTEGQ